MGIGIAKTIYQKWKFTVLVDGFTEFPITFSKVGPLEANVSTLEHHSGGAMIPFKAPGKASFANITLEKGATENRDLMLWFEQVVSVAANTGLDYDAYKRGITIIQEDRVGAPVKTYRLFGAFPVKFTPGDWDASAEEFTIESMELAYDFFQSF